MDIAVGDFVEVRGRAWLVEGLASANGLDTIDLSCIADDAQGERLRLLWDAEASPTVLSRDAWARLGQGSPDGADVLAAYVRVVRHSRRA